MAATVPTPPEQPTRFKFPTAYTILLALVVLVAAMTWIIPAGKYERVASELLGKDIPIAGTYAPTDPNPQGFSDVILAPIAGFYDPASSTANAIDVALFVLMIGGFIGVVTATGSIDAGIKRAMTRLKGREKWMIPILMGLFALGGTTEGMAEETLAFYILLTPVMIAAGYDSLTAAAVIMLGAEHWRTRLNRQRIFDRHRLKCRSNSKTILSAILRPNTVLAAVMPVVAALLAMTLFWAPARELFGFGVLRGIWLAVPPLAGIGVLLALEGLKPFWHLILLARAKDRPGRTRQAGFMRSVGDGL